MSVSTGPESDDERKAGASQHHPVEADFAALVEAVAGALVEAVQDDDPVRVARECGQLLEALHQQVLTVQSARDSALMQVLKSSPTTSHYALARELGVSRQRIDQLAARVEATGARDADQVGGG